MRVLWLAVCCLMMTSAAFASPEETASNRDWLKIYYQNEGLQKVSPTKIDNIDSITYRIVPAGNGENAETQYQTLMCVTTRRGQNTLIPVDSIQSMERTGHIPTLYITTDPYVKEIPNKEDYLDAIFYYEPYGDGTDTLNIPVSIKGRGNSSWWYGDKKPYRLKFDKKQSIPGLNKAKSFVLLANYFDNTLLKNAVAFKIAELIGLPYTNKVLPVNVVLNGRDLGNYMITNKIGINAGSVDIDEEEGVLWEIDVTYDEDFRFTTSYYLLPCMLKDPDPTEIFDNDEELINEYWTYWKQDLNTALREVRRGNWTDTFDAEQFVKYVLVFDLTLNRELSHPKSMYMYKENKEGKYKLGPVWDFDWAFNFATIGNETMLDPKLAANRFFVKIMEDSTFLELFRKELDDFCENHLDELMDFIDEYAAIIRDSALEDSRLWPKDMVFEREQIATRNAREFDKNVADLKQFIYDRIELIRNSENFMLYKLPDPVPENPPTDTGSQPSETITPETPEE